MIERENQIHDRAETERLAWIRPELHKLDAGDAELGANPHADSVISTS